MQSKENSTLFSTPFSAKYWKSALQELKNPRTLVIAAVMIALRVALKQAKLPVGQDLNVQIAFFINALGAMIFGPVVAVISAAVSDTLGCALTGFAGYFFPFIFVEIAGSLVFALWLWRAKLSATRIILSRFSVVVVCNFIMNPAIMNWYYAWINNGKYYAFLNAPRIVKNVLLFPAESFLLVLFLGAVSIPIMKLGFLPKGLEKPKFEKKHIILLVVLFAFSIIVNIPFVKGIVEPIKTAEISAVSADEYSKVVFEDNEYLVIESIFYTKELYNDASTAADITVRITDFDGNVIIDEKVIAPGKKTSLSKLDVNTKYTLEVKSEASDVKVRVE